MLDIVQVDHIGIRVSDRDVSLAFYAQLGFRALHDGGFDQGHPVILQHPSGVVVNLLGPSMAGAARNVLMDEPDKYSGYTHVALRVASLEATQTALAAAGIEITGGPIRYSDHAAGLFIRDPDSTVIELIENAGEVSI